MMNDGDGGRGQVWSSEGVTCYSWSTPGRPRTRRTCCSCRRTPAANQRWAPGHVTRSQPITADLARAACAHAAARTRGVGHAAEGAGGVWGRGGGVATPGGGARVLAQVEGVAGGQHSCGHRSSWLVFLLTSPLRSGTNHIKTKTKHEVCGVPNSVRRKGRVSMARRGRSVRRRAARSCSAPRRETGAETRCLPPGWGLFYCQLQRRPSPFPLFAYGFSQQNNNDKIPALLLAIEVRQIKLVSRLTSLYFITTLGKVCCIFLSFPTFAYNVQFKFKGKDYFSPLTRYQDSLKKTNFTFNVMGTRPALGNISKMSCCHTKKKSIIIS